MQPKSDQEKTPEDSKLLDSAPAGCPAVPVKVQPVSVLLAVSPYAVAVLLCFLVTLGCFPAITAQVGDTGYQEKMPLRCCWRLQCPLPRWCPPRRRGRSGGTPSWCRWLASSSLTLETTWGGSWLGSSSGPNRARPEASSCWGSALPGSRGQNVGMGWIDWPCAIYFLTFSNTI